MDSILHLGLSLALGLVIGMERGWHERDEAEGSRPAGIRTFGLISLSGGLTALLARELGALVLGFALVAVTIVLVMGHVVDARSNRDVGITTVAANAG